jgi:hypothetical protein
MKRIGAGAVAGLLTVSFLLSGALATATAQETKEEPISIVDIKREVGVEQTVAPARPSLVARSRAMRLFSPKGREHPCQMRPRQEPQ